MELETLIVNASGDYTLVVKNLRTGNSLQMKGKLTESQAKYMEAFTSDKVTEEIGND